MAGGVDYVDLGAFVSHRNVLRENSDTTFSLEIVRVENEFAYFFVFAKQLHLLKDLVYQCGFTVVDVGDNCDITNVHAERFFKRACKSSLYKGLVSISPWFCGDSAFEKINILLNSNYASSSLTS